MRAKRTFDSAFYRVQNSRCNKHYCLYYSSPFSFEIEMSKGVKVSPKLDWKTSKGFQVWYICSICNRAYKEPEKLKEHKHQVHFPNPKKRRAYRKSVEKTETLAEDPQTETTTPDLHSASEMDMDTDQENKHNGEETQVTSSENPVPVPNEPGILATE